jgi:hypothetical protein
VIIGSAVITKFAIVAITAAVLLAIVLSDAIADSRLELYPLFTLSEEYTDNLENSAVNSLSDEITTVIGGGSLAYTDRNRTAQLNYLTDGQLYAEHSSFDRALRDHFAGLNDLEHLSQTTTLSLSDSFLKGQPVFSQALIGAQGISAQLGQSLLQQDYTTDYFDARLRHDFSKSSSVSCDLHENWTSSGGSGISSVNAFQQGGSVTAYYAVAQTLSVGPTYDFEDYRFSDAPRTDSHAPAISASWYPEAKFQVTGQGGPLIVETGSHTQVDYGYSIIGQYTGERLKLSINSGRGTGISATRGTTTGTGAGITQYAGGSLSYALARETNAFSTIYYSSTNGAGISNDILAFSVGVQHRLTRTLSINAQYVGYRTVIPNTPSVFTNTVVIGLKYTGLPWRWVW